MLRIVTISCYLALSFSTNLNNSQGPFKLKIIGGNDVQISEIPYQAALEYYGRQHCGASIISKYHVVTAAHCTYGVSDTINAKIRAGSSERQSGGELYQVLKFNEHPLFNPRTTDYDVCVIQIQDPFEFNLKISPIPLATTVAQDGQEALVSGWGNLYEDGPSSNVLQAVLIKTINHKECNKIYENDYPVTDRMICAGVFEGGHGHCNGDSGGPLVVKEKLVGIVSWSTGCGRPGFPGVYANVVELSDFIQNITGLQFL